MSELSPEMRRRVESLEVERATRSPLYSDLPSIERWDVAWLEPESEWEVADDPEFTAVGHLGVVAGRLLGRDLLGDLDDEHAMLAQVGDAILDADGELVDEIENSLSTWQPLVLIIEDVRFDPDYIHPALPAYLIGRALRAMSPGVCLIVVAREWHSEVDPTVWDALGFKPFRDTDVWLVDTGRFDLGDAVELLAQSLGLPPARGGG
jgi:hypothetical protein